MGTVPRRKRSNMSRLAARIRKARNHARLSQLELAGLLGVSRGAVANWESTSAVVPASERLQRLALVTRVSYEWLATGRGAPSYDTTLDDIPAGDMEMVEDPLELRLLRAFRACPQRQHARILEMVEKSAPPPRNSRSALSTGSRASR